MNNRRSHAGGYTWTKQERDLLSRVLRRLFDVQRDVYKVLPSLDLLKRGLVRYRADPALLQAVYTVGNIVSSVAAMLGAVNDAIGAVRVDPRWPTQTYGGASIRLIDNALMAISFAQQYPLSVARQKFAIPQLAQGIDALMGSLGTVSNAILAVRAAIADLQYPATYRTGVTAANHGINSLQGGFAHLDNAVLDIERALFYSTSEARELGIFFCQVTPATAALYGCAGNEPS